MAARTCYITFYSYKGGVGRTLALANCARALVASGKKIVLMDFDLEAPGLHHFQPFQPNSRIKRPQGFAEYLEASLNHGPPASLDAYLHPCLGKDGDKGRAWLMPAGRHDEPGYLGFLNGTTWNDFYTQREGYKILEHLRGHIIHDYQPDYVFIDARTGLSEIGGIATHQLADIVVLVFNLNGQNLEGAKRVFDSIKKAPLPPKVILLASPVPVMPTDKHTPFAKKMQAIKKGFKGAENADKPLVIPYHPLLAIDDRLLVDDGDLFSSDAPYRRVVDLIQQVANDVDIYLQQMVGPMQRGDWQEVRDIALQGLQVHPTQIQLLWHLALAYSVTDATEKELAAYNELLRYHADTTVLNEQVLVAQSLYNKGCTLGQLQRPEEALAAYGQLLERFADAKELVLQRPVANAWNGKGFYLLLEAKKSAPSEQRHRLLQTALNCFDQTLVHVAATDRAIVLGNQAYTQFLLGDSVASATTLKDALTLGGQALYEVELADSQTTPLPEDEAFRTLLDKLWQETKQVA